MFNKRGEITTQQIVLLVILITSFAVVLFFLFRLNLGEETNKEICRNSVVLKGNTFAGASAQLNCKRSYECITADGTCEGLNKPIKHRATSKEDVYKTLADKMTECWWMFGEGKVDYVEDTLDTGNYCSICSQITLDDSLSTIGDNEGNPVFENNEINEDEFYNYLTLAEKSDGTTYAEYLFETNDLTKIKQDSLNEKGVGTFGTLDIGKEFFVVTGITNNVDKFSWWFGGGTAGTVIGAIGAAVTLSNPIGIIGGAIVLAGTAAGTVGGEVASRIEGSDYYNPEIGAIVVEGRGTDNTFMAPTILEADSDKFKALNCREILTLS